ncbi:unnamed protein product [Rotaria sordida]|uniref:Uncharacterized protein n=1 Tax=Rotaria sordida TaxID=392033 RepID=A0A818JY54_9BILA|nr:unnamed protein product [Rotaria sordida]CAF3550577.1 unnamed protein product [Rotaria sordida]CAF3758046.1 unnamed protein product [Rotaria sordida]
MMFHGICSQMIGPKPTTTPPPPPPPTCPSIDEITSTMEKLFDAQTKILLSKLADMEARLNELTSNKPLAPSELFMGIYENITIFDDWILLYNKPYNHNTTSKELKDIANQCNSNRVVVGALQNENSSILSIAAVGPKYVLYHNTAVDAPEEIENVLWYLEPGRSFGFRPIESDPDEPPRSELFLSWSIDVNYGGWRAGEATNLYQNSIWHKVIYCMPTF